MRVLSNNLFDQSAREVFLCGLSGCFCLYCVEHERDLHDTKHRQILWRQDVPTKISAVRVSFAARTFREYRPGMDIGAVWPANAIGNHNRTVLPIMRDQLFLDMGKLRIPNGSPAWHHFASIEVFIVRRVDCMAVRVKITFG